MRRSEVAALMRMRLYGLFGINRLIHSGSAAEKRRAALMVLVAVGFAGVAAVLSTAVSCGMAEAGLTGSLPAISVLLCTFLVLTTTFLKSPGVLAGGNDYDLVMSLPVTPAQVVVSRVAAVYLTDVLLCAVVIVPAALVFAAHGGGEAPGVALFLLSVLVVPVLPLVVALAVGTVVAVVSSRAKRGNVLSLVLSTLLVLALVAATGMLKEAGGANVAVAVGALSDAFVAVWPPAVLVERCAEGDVLPFFALAAFSVVLAGVFVAVASRLYRGMNDVRLHRSENTLRVADLKMTTPFFAMYRRELSRYVSCTIYALNSSIGAVLLLAFSVLLLFAVPDAIEMHGGEVDLRAMLRPALPFVVAVFVSMTCTTSASLSLEGKNRWIMCSLPVRPIEVFRSKMAVSLSVIAPFAVASIALLVAAMRVTGLDLIFLVVIPAVYACFISVLGMCLNVRFPRYDWTSEYYAVKGGAVSVLATTGLGMACSVVPLGVCLGLPQYGTLIAAVAAAALALVTAVLYRWLERQRLYEG